MIEQSTIYETSSVDLATFLVLEGIKLLECRKENNIVILRFLDDKKLCLDLERVYLKSEHKRYRDINKWLLKKIHETMRGKCD